MIGKKKNRQWFIICVLIIGVFMTSCTQIEKQKDVEVENYSKEPEHDVEPKYSFMSNYDIEQLIEQHSTTFLSFWIGMSEEESTEVIRYLIDIGKISGLIYSSEKGDYEELSAFNIKNQAFKNKSRKLFYHLSTGRNTLTSEVELTFNNENNKKSLERISLAIIDFIDEQDFYDLTALYKSKFGNPVKIQNKPFSDVIKTGDTYRRYSFEEGDKSIDVEYNSEHTSFNGGKSPNQIHIYYSDKRILKMRVEKFRNQKKEENERMQQKKDNTIKDI
jgi:hypothetical protein